VTRYRLGTNQEQQREIRKMANVSNQGYAIEKTAGRKFYITSKKYGNIFGPFTRKSWAIDYAKRIDAAS
jgi:hypothetical protein